MHRCCAAKHLRGTGMELLTRIDPKAERFVQIDSSDGYVSGSGSGSSSGDGSGDGYGDGYGYDDGSGDGSGYGSGDVSGSGSGYDDGYGYGRLCALGAYCGSKVYAIDDVPTLIDAVLGSYAKGRILMDDMTTSPCYIAKEGRVFAHGDTLRDAQTVLWEKLFDDMPLDERITAFLDCHTLTDAYPNRDLFEWHHRLTGSCLAGRKAWVQNHGIDMDGSTTVADFIRLCKDDFGRDAIRALKERIEKHD